MTLPNQLNSEVDDVLWKVAWMPVLEPLWKMGIAIGVIVLSAWIMGNLLEEYISRPLFYGAHLVLVIACAVLGWLEHRWVLGYRVRVRERINDAGVIERLALGCDALNEIYEYTPFPWTMFLGPKPTTIRRATALLVNNLGWYLGQPRTWFDSSWLFNALAIILFVAMSVYNIHSLHTQSFSHPMYFLRQQAITLLFPIYFWGTSYYMLRSKLGARALLDELKERARG